MISRRSFLKKLLAATTTALVAPKIAFDLVKQDDFTASNFKTKVSYDFADRARNREEAKAKLAQWWAEQFDEILMKELTK